MHRASRRVAVPSRYRRSAIGGCAEDREARTPDRAAAAATQGNSAGARANAKTDRAGGSQGRSRAGALFGPAAHGYQGPATAASAGKGEGDVGRLHRRRDGVGQHNMVNDIGTAFATTPYPFSPLYNEHEFHGT